MAVYCMSITPRHCFNRRIVMLKGIMKKNVALVDYKIHCFDGVPKAILVCKDRFAKCGLPENFFDTEGVHTGWFRM